MKTLLLIGGNQKELSGRYLDQALEDRVQDKAKT